ncbi:DUF747-domain-containing protein [Xylariaceae sp. FL0804]|nr:DUF747-domain-containing protein [Xylariaceae sp. FL0804]
MMPEYTGPVTVDQPARPREAEHGGRASAGAQRGRGRGWSGGQHHGDDYTKQLSPQYPTPPPDPFPVLEVTSATPTTPQRPPDRTEATVAGSDPMPHVDTRPPSLSEEATNAYADSACAVSDTHGSPVSSKPPSRRSTDAGSKPRTPTATKKESHEKIRKLSASQMQALTSSPDSLPVAIAPAQRRPNGTEYPLSAGIAEGASRPSMAEQLQEAFRPSAPRADGADRINGVGEDREVYRRTATDFRRPRPGPRTLSTPPTSRKSASSGPMTAPNPGRRNSYNTFPRPTPLHIPGASSDPPSAAPKSSAASRPQQRAEPGPPSPMPSAIPIPPMSLPTHLQLELAGQRPSPLYIHHSHAADAPYESSAVKFERLLNALVLPAYLERIFFFGTMACLDAWLYTFTILPLRFFVALGVLMRWWARAVWREARWMTRFVWQGTWRLWQRGRRGRPASRAWSDSSRAASEAERSPSRPRENGAGPPQNGTARRRMPSDAVAPSLSEPARSGSAGVFHPPKHAMPRTGSLRHRRTRSVPSSLTSYHKADLLQGAVLVCSSVALMNLDASRMYHFIRAQSSMKLYVIYNILEVGDRLLSAIGQDILECLFSSETLSRNSSGRSKILLPFGMFVLSLFYNVLHTWCLFYQVITLNVAVNSYSNSLLTLLISNQFVEIKGSVFKKIEKENLFQLTCSDVVERFQIWIILLIIGMRNVVEVGGLSVPGAGSELDGGAAKAGPLHTSSILPASFTVLPAWLRSGEVLSPFLVVVGIEMMVDWIKHAYINKFNNVKPTIYRRMLDILCKDYYTNAFSTPSLTRRLGLPLLPLSCLFIRASIQVYHMFLATHLHPPLPTSTSTTDLSMESSAPSSPAMTAALEHLDTLIRGALGRAVYGQPYGGQGGQGGTARSTSSWWAFSSDDAIALLTMVVFFFLAWVVLLIVKLLLGMFLLRYAQRRYAVMKLKEHHAAQAAARAQAQAQAAGDHQKAEAAAAAQATAENFSQPGQRVGAFSAVELGDDRRKWLYEDDAEGLRRMRDRERKTQERLLRDPGGDDALAKVVRYEMVAKRIW